MAANTERTGDLGHRFKDSALERRRPSKRQTTVRSFSIVRSWKSLQNTSSSSADPNSHNKDKPTSSTAKRLVVIPEAPTNGMDAVSTSNSAVFPSQHSARRSMIIPRESPTPFILTSPRALSIIDMSVPLEEASTQAALGNSPDSIVLASPQAPLLMSASSSAELHVSTSATPAPTDLRPISQKTPCSGPGTFRGGAAHRKRKRVAVPSSAANDQECDADYRESKFVRLFNADQGRSKSMQEITDLDVILTAIEEVALEYRNEVEGSVGRQAVKEFFIQVRKILTDRIDSYKEYLLLKSDLRKAKSRVTKYRKELLNIQQQRSKVKAKLAKFTSQQQKPSERHEALEEISKFLTDLEALEKQSREAVSSKKLSKKDYASTSNLPGILIEGYSLVTAARQLGSVNDSLQQWLTKTTRS